jgi:hypothetical protein
MRIPQQSAHKRTEPMPVMDKLGSRTLDDFGFTGHSKGCSMNPRKVDKVFFGDVVGRHQGCMIDGL